MKIGLILPTGYWGEFAGWHPGDVWRRILAIARKAESLGFGSVWVGEHTAPKWEPETPLYDGPTILTAIAGSVPRVEIGFVVLNATFRNAALLAKSATTIDAISDGRVILGLGAGFREIEAVPFGVPYPPLGERMALLADTFEIVSRMTRAGEPPPVYQGRHRHVAGAVNAPRTAGRDHLPLLIGGHGPNVTFRLAARYCDEINIDVMPDRMAEAISRVRERCEEIGRDPFTLGIDASLRGSWPYADVKVTGGQRMIRQADMPAVMDLQVAASESRVEELARWREAGVDRLVCGVPGLATTDEPLYELIEHIEAAGIGWPE